MSVSRARLSATLLVLAAATACDKTEPLVPANLEAVSATSFSSTAGEAVPTASRPSVKVTTSSGKVVPNVSVTFAVISGGGTGGGAVVTNSEGIATASWTLGTTAGANVMNATAAAVTSVTFTATGTAGSAAKLAFVTQPSSTAQNRTAFATQPVVQLQDANSNAVATAGVTVTAGISAGGGTLQGTVDAATNAQGRATWTNLAIAGTAGARTLNFTSSILTAVTSQVTTSAGAAASVAKDAGDNQAAFPSTSVPIPPAVKVADVDGNGVSGTQVTFAVTSGGGSVQGATATSNSSGVAAVTSWTLGSALGTNTLAATAAGLTGSPLTFTATSTNTLVDVTAVSPATLTSGATATISGSGFSATPANNTVTIDGLPATVTAASGTSLTVTVPTLACTPAHSGAVSVTVSGVTGSRNHPIAAATQHTLSAGQSVILSTAAAARCNELHNANGNALYYVSVYNTNPTYSTTGAAFELKGTAGAAAAVVGERVVPQRAAAARPGPRRRQIPEGARDDAAHVDLLERDLTWLRQNGRRWRDGRAQFSVANAISGSAAVGDAVTVRLRDLDASGCTTFLTVNGRVAYVGTKNIIVEDLANAVLNIDTTYAQIGQEFDAVMFPILETNYGNPLVNDAVLDNNGRFVMVFTNKIRTMAGGGIAGFVSPCDFFPQSGTTTSSNVGEYFYAIAPQQAGTINTSTNPGGQSPPLWRWAIRGTIIHEVKHIVSTGERFSRNNGTVFEDSWLEESTARLSEELFERARYGFTQRSNIGYGSAGNPVGPYCGVRACGTAPNNQARGIVRVFEELGPNWYQAPQNYSPIGRISSSDFTFYATAWSLLRWTIDANASKTEAAILKGMTQEPTLTGISNFSNQMGMTFVDALPKWTLAMVVDDYPGFTPADATLKQPSWNFRDVFAGYKQDFPTASFAAWPFAPSPNLFGAFTATNTVRAGTAAILQVSGTQAAKQLLELKASGSSAAAPAELRMAIVRIQ